MSGTDSSNPSSSTAESATNCSGPAASRFNVTIGGNGPVIEAGLGADVAVTSFRTAGAAFGLPAVFRIGMLRAAGAVFLTVLT